MRAAAAPPEVLMLLGTRPEGIKLAPLARQLRRAGITRVALVDTGQHPGRVDEALEPFDLTCEVRLDLCRRTGSLAELGAQLLTEADAVLTMRRPRAVVVQGDTLTAFVGGLAAFWHQLPVVHLEAGLRTHDLSRPFPEEASRAMLARFAALHLAPTPIARTQLLAEGVPAPSIVVTGNTVVDALHHILDSGQAVPPSWVDRSRRVIVVTAHRRENWGRGIAGVATALRRLATDVPELQIVAVTHPNPALSAAMTSLLHDVPGVTVTPPLGYPAMVGLLKAACLVVTDSGGIQEEAATLGTPLLVTRESTERPEAVAPGTGVVVGTDPDRIVTAARAYLSADRQPARRSPFGDGHAAKRAARAIHDLLATTRPVTNRPVLPATNRPVSRVTIHNGQRRPEPTPQLSIVDS